MKFSKSVTIFLSVISSVLLFIFLGWHWQLGLTRYFDVDEFAYLHWAYQVFAGQKPYIDFFLYVPPGFQWFLAPLFLLGKGVAPLLAARAVSFGVFALLALTTVYLFWLRRKSWPAVAAGAILAFLPLPFDKFLEIRPDNLSALLVVVGVIEEIRWMRKKKAKDGFLAGIFYALSLIVLPKSVPAVAVAFLVGFVFILTSKKQKIGLPAIAGFSLPVILFGLWALTLGNFPLVFYSLVRLPFEVNKIGRIFYMAPDLFFYPNQIFYGVGGWSQGLIINHLIWITGLLVGIIRLFTPFLADNKEDRNAAPEELLISGIFIVQVIYYILWSPLKHAQYLIPIAVFVAFYAADGVDFVWQKAKGQWGREVFLGVAFIMAGLGLYRTNSFVETPKLTMSNVSELAIMKKIFAAIPADAYLLDLDGRTLYYKNPYYICCLPFGQHRPFLSWPFPELTPALAGTQTKYIWQGELERVKTLLLGDQAYINEHYIPAEIPGLLIRQ